MSCFTCPRRTLFADLSRAAAKLAGDRLRRLGAVRQQQDWPRRAIICERCPLRVLRGNVAYCGKPLLSQFNRSALDGCGCPIIAKAKDPSEHCPLDARHRPVAEGQAVCTCKWCHAASAG